MTTVGLRIPTNLSYEDWERAGRKLSVIVDSSAWWLGDWLVYGKKHYTDRYKQAIQTVGLRYQTLRNYAWVAGRFDLARRRSALTFQHHAEVASLPLDVQNELLDRAERGAWTTKQLRASIRDSHNANPGADPALPGSRPHTEVPGEATVTALNSPHARIEVPDRIVRTWRKAADRVGMNFDIWVLSSLDRAAEQALRDEFRGRELRAKA